MGMRDNPHHMCCSRQAIIVTDMWPTLCRPQADGIVNVPGNVAFSGEPDGTTYPQLQRHTAMPAHNTRFEEGPQCFAAVP